MQRTVLGVTPTEQEVIFQQMDDAELLGKAVAALLAGDGEAATAETWAFGEAFGLHPSAATALVLKAAFAAGWEYSGCSLCGEPEDAHDPERSHRYVTI